MSYAHELWPISGKSFFDIDNQSYLVHIKWSRNLKSDYRRLSENFFICGYKICEKIVDSGHDNIKSDMWYLPSMYLFRQGMELGIKALICDVVASKNKIQQIFLGCKHDLYMLFEAYEVETTLALTLDEYHWIKKYLLSLEEVDAKSDLFRFSFEDDFLSIYRDEFLDVVDMANSMLQAYGIIQKCLQIPESERIDRFDPNRSSDFLQFTSHGFGNCSLWESISGDGFHKQVLGYSLATEFLFYECNEISKEDKIFAILFLLRNLIELGLKRIFYKTIEHGVPRNIFLSKRRSHLLYKELWKNVRPMIEYYAITQGQDLEIVGECMTGTQMDSIFHECGVRDTSNESTKWKRIFYTFQAKQEVDGSSNAFLNFIKAAKSLSEKVREKTGLQDDGSVLFNTAFSVNNPRLALNSLQTSTERNLQNGLKEMLNGVTHMVRNVTAYELKVKWVVNEQDAIDILTTISYLHKQLDECFMVPQHII